MRRLAPLLLTACGALPPPVPVRTTPILPTPVVVAPAKPVPPKTERALLARIARVLDQAASLRRLPAKRPVAGAVLSRAELLAQLKRHVQKEVPPEAIVREGNALKLAGVLEPSVDYEAIMYRLLEEQLAGFYAPEDETMSLAGDLDDEMVDATLIHELTHALQDQYFDLKPGSKYHPGQSDSSFAHSALAEGDATSAMTDFMLGGSENQGAPSVETENKITFAMQAAMPSFAPLILQRSLVAPYVYGLRFVNTLRRRGGWDAVNAAWRAPPTTSEQIIHPEKYERHEPALVVATPSAATLGPAWKSDDEDSSGELGLRLVFETWFGRTEGASLARGWGGDRSVMLRDGGGDGAIALVDHLRYDADQRPQAVKLAGALGKLWGVVAAAAPSGVVAFCKERSTLGPAVVVAKKAGDAVLSFGPAAADGFGSRGTCADATKAALSELDR